MLNRLIAWARAHRNLFIWLGLGLALVICWSIWSNIISDSTPNTQPISAQNTAPAGGWFFWKFLAFLELLGALLAFRANPQSERLPIVFVLAFVGSCLVIYGEFKELFQWAVAGTPMAAYFFFLMSQRAKSERQSAFLMTVCGILSLTFVYLLFKKLGLIVSIEAALKDYTGLSINILLIFAGLFGGLTIYKRKVSFCVIAFLFLGFWSYDSPQIQHVFNTLNPTISGKTKNTWENVWDSALREVNSAVTPTPKPNPVPQSTPAPTSTTAPIPTPAAKSVAQPTSGKIDRYVIPATGTPPFSEVIQVGGWNVFPLGTTVREVWEGKPRITNGSVIVLRETKQCFFPPPGTKEIVLTRK